MTSISDMNAQCGLPLRSASPGQLRIRSAMRPRASRSLMTTNYIPFLHTSANEISISIQK